MCTFSQKYISRGSYLVIFLGIHFWRFFVDRRIISGNCGDKTREVLLQCRDNLNDKGMMVMRMVLFTIEYVVPYRCFPVSQRKS